MLYWPSIEQEHGIKTIAYPQCRAPCSVEMCFDVFAVKYKCSVSGTFSNEASGRRKSSSAGQAGMVGSCSRGYSYEVLLAAVANGINVARCVLPDYRCRPNVSHASATKSSDYPCASRQKS